MKKKKKAPRKSVLQSYLMPEDLVNLVSQGVTHALDRHPVIRASDIKATEMAFNRDTKSTASIPAMDGYGAPPHIITTRIKKTPVWKKLLALAIPMVLAVGVMGVLRLKDGPPAGAKYRIKHNVSMLPGYSVDKPTLIAGDCVAWVDVDGRALIACGPVEISEIPGRIPLPVQEKASE